MRERGDNKRVNPEPFRIEPTFSPRIWGARSLAPLYPDKKNLAEPIGEAWLTDMKCRVATGAFSGKTLGEAWREMPAEWRGSKFAEPGDFPLLMKFIFPTDKLSIQVHPDDAYASVHEKAAGGRGKTEMWHAVSAQEDASVLVGLKPGVNKEQFLAALESHNVEDLFCRHPVGAGDTFFVPARTPHTIGPGMVFCEVQQYSDLTYRVYDYGRTDRAGNSRELHLEKALDVMDFSSASVKVVPAALEPLPDSDSQLRHLLLCACRYFATERLEFSERCVLRPDRSRFEVTVVLSGRGNVGWPSSAARYEAGQCWLIPAAVPSVSFQALQPTILLRACVPDLEALEKTLHDSGVSAAAISHSVFR